jgi:hypothetical protein
VEKFLEYLQIAEKKIQTVDHMIYVTFPLIKDKRLLLKILSETNIIILHIINAILQYEYLYKRIELTKDARTNLRIFIDNCVPYYKITDSELKLILQVLDLTEKHKKSPFEFIKEEKVVILSESLRPEIITLEKSKEFLLMTKSLLKKTRENIHYNLR